MRPKSKQATRSSNARLEISIRGAREHNLRDVSLRLPKNQLIVMTGVSGSGKSSLAFDTLYAEGQRRYVESLSSYARQFLGQMPKPEVDAITGLAPSISIQQKASGRNPRSTVGTITEIYDYLRVLYARVGRQNCPQCHRPITAQSVEQIIDTISQLENGTRFQILSPLIQGQKGEYRDLFDDLLKQGFVRARVDGRLIQLSDDLRLDKQMRHTIEVVVDRLVAGKATRARLAETVELALKLSHGTLILLREGEGPRAENQAPENQDADEANSGPSALSPEPAATRTDQLFSSHYACTHCGLSFDPPSPQLFSFNSPQGMCLDCNGLGERFEFVIEQLIAEPDKSLWTGAIGLLGPVGKIGRWRKHIYQGVARAIETELDLLPDSMLKTPWNELPQAAQDKFLHGLGDRHITFEWRYSGGIWRHGGNYKGYLPELLESYRKTNNSMRRKQLEKYMKFVRCTACGGQRLNRQAAAVTLTSQSERFRRLSGTASQARNKTESNELRGTMSLPEVCQLDIQSAYDFFESLELTDTQQLIAVEVLKEIRGRLGFLLRCGLNYLTLERTAPTLSGGESQRIRLAGQIGCGLVDVVYILDEPSIGLHPRDNTMLLGSLCELRDQGNTVIVVEHDEETMRAADHIVDFGPGPGVRGGEVVAEGPLDRIRKSKRSVTGQFLSGRRSIATPASRRAPNGKKLTIEAATHHNLKGIDVEIPLGLFVCVTGVSGSGKSSLVNDILWEVLNREINEGHGYPGTHRRIQGLEHLDKAIDIDQSPIGRTPRSNPATYVKLFDAIRDLYTKLPEARLRGYKPGRFSFNVPGGRCEACEGHGANKLEMDFLADIWVTCPVCGGKRFNHETLEVRYKGKHIAEVLDMDVQEALQHFDNLPQIQALLQTLHDVGLDYLKLGQPSPTLSGGEAQRIKLARELGKRSTGRTIYLLDEPTTGLHFADIEKLLEVLHGFVDAGNTVLVVEHNLDVIKTADWIIDLGPEGGSGGGTVVAVGTPEEIADCSESHTGRALRALWDGSMAQDSGPTAEGKTQISGQALGLKPSALGPPQITIRGAAQHNLQHVDITIPREQMNVFCGPSGSGKTSLAMDTLYAEGQRRYVESLSAYARQFLGQMPKPRIEHIHGLQPAIAIEQKTVGSTPRSTVGTVTEIYDYLRILWCRLGTVHCPECQQPVDTQTTDQVVNKLFSLDEGTRLLLLAPQEVRVGQVYDRLWENLREQGFARVRIDGTTYRLDDVPTIDRKSKHVVEVVVDRVTIKHDQRSRLADSIEDALDLGHGVMRAAYVDEERDEQQWRVESFNLHCACDQCGRSFESLTPNNFSFNSPLGWCKQCEGLGTQRGTDLRVLVGDPNRTLAEAAVSAWPDPATTHLFSTMLHAMAKELGWRLDIPFSQLDPQERHTILYGAGEHWFSAAATRERPGFRFQYKGLFPAIEEAARVSYSYRMRLAELVGDIPCATCDGSRLRDDAANVRFQGKTLQQLCELPLNQAYEFLDSISLSGPDARIAGDLLSEAKSRMSFLLDVGLEYLTLLRPLPTLSGGESQRIRLAGQIGRALTGVLYVLDEPTIGLHPRDNARLLKALRKLRDLGNTLVLVEHDKEVISAADCVYDFGPGSGRFGGTIVDSGSPRELAKRAKSLTGQYLGRKREILIPQQRRITGNVASAASSGLRAKGRRVQKPLPQLSSALGSQPSALSHPAGWLELIGARLHNLRDVHLRIPLATFTVVTGVSGSGKSSLIEHTLAKALLKLIHRATEQPGPYSELRGLHLIDKAIIVDQQPIGFTPKSNPGTYTGVFDHIRELFARLPDAKVRGYSPGRFSFNRPGGRCEACEGDGQKKIEMHFLPDVWVECDDCHGQRYNRETLAVKYRGHSVADVLNLSIGQCHELFANIPAIRKPLATLCAIGLDYLTLGQSSTTLSGGEAQRVKLAAELARPNTGKTIYILDEPTTGLHFDDIEKLLKVLNSLVELGNTVVVIEHNLDVIKTADWIIDLGPEAGSGGGWIVAEGTPENLVEGIGAKTNGRGVQETNGSQPSHFHSHTAEQLAPVLAAGRRGDREVFNAAAEGKKRSGDVSISEVGKEAKMPWEADGRQWHTRDRIAHNGKPCRWDGDALVRVIEALEGQAAEVREASAGNDYAVGKKSFRKNARGSKRVALTGATGAGKLIRASELLRSDPQPQKAAGAQPSAPSPRLKTLWNDPSTVEVTGESARYGWFVHALTRDEWLLKLKFRVEKNRFDEAGLRKRLKLKPVDEIQELPIYGRGERVIAKNQRGAFQEVTITIHGQQDIDTPEFWQFLDEARESYLRLVSEASSAPEDVTPWKVLGRKWHLLQKGFPNEKRPKWKAEVLEQLFATLDDVLPASDIVWTERQFVRYRRPGSKDDWAVIVTKRRAGVDMLIAPESEIGTGAIADLASEHEIVPGKNGRQSIRLRFLQAHQVASPRLKEFLRSTLATT